MRKVTALVFALCCLLAAMLLSSCGYEYDEAVLEYGNGYEIGYGNELAGDESPNDLSIEASYMAIGGTTPPRRVLFSGDAAVYTLYWSADREQNWEADIIYFASLILGKHPLFAESTPLFTALDILEMRAEPTATVNLYNKITRLGFLTRVNALIDRIPYLSDDEIISALSVIVTPTGSRCLRVTATQDIVRTQRITYLGDIELPATYWFELCNEYDLIHVTLLSCYGIGDFSTWGFMLDLIETIEYREGIDVLVLDLRGHRGNSILGNFIFFAMWLDHRDNSDLIGNFYIAIDQGTNSLGIAYTALFQSVVDATIIGAPTASYANFFGGRSYVTYLPNSGARVAIPHDFFNMMPHLGFEVLTPDVFVNNSGSSAENRAGNDAILEYIRNMIRRNGDVEESDENH